MVRVFFGRHKITVPSCWRPTTLPWCWWLIPSDPALSSLPELKAGFTSSLFFFHLFTLHYRPIYTPPRTSSPTSYMPFSSFTAPSWPLMDVWAVISWASIIFFAPHILFSKNFQPSWGRVRVRFIMSVREPLREHEATNQPCWCLTCIVCYWMYTQILF